MDFTQALRSGSLEKIKELIENGADIHAENDYALRWASENGHLDVVRLLLENGYELKGLLDKISTDP